MVLPIKQPRLGKRIQRLQVHLKKITIGSNVKKMQRCMVNCRKLASISDEKGNGITSIGAGLSKINSKAKWYLPSKTFQHVQEC